ncbi:MAG: endo-1,4-beta-xylanase [Bacteroidaceae bacterium]|nr:endo-1,4-beta-xylanase [Bacteroidaceae bacterium]
MHKKCLWGGLLLLLSGTLPAQEVMSEGYRRMWNDSVQQAIDQNIEKHRKADAKIVLKNAEAGTEVRVEQVTSDFLFGSNIFLYGQLDTPQKNQRYEDAFGTLFNQATIAFYWKTLEPEKGLLRFTADSPYEYRRPPTDPVVEFCQKKGLYMKGHAIIYGIRRWGHPTWLSEERKEMESEFETHIKTLAKRYGNRIQNWDVVNECYDQANRGIMPDDYTYKSYRWAMKYFPKEVTFNTNECDMHWGSNKRYVEIVRDLIERGAKIDNCGVQMHIFDPNEAVQIAEGKSDILSPKKLWATLNCLMETGRPTFISEVTISAPDDTEYGRAVQRELTRDFYRLWFSHPNVRGITWWNLIDGGAAPGEPSFSGLLDKEGNPKPSYEILDKLINHEWKTRLNLKADMDGKISFRGFRGTYRITYMNRKGKKVTMQYKL